MDRVLYLHGFASSPDGQKAHAVASQLERRGVAFEAPDLNVPSFAALNFDAAVDSILRRAELHPPDVIVGSSLGGLMALETVRRGVRAPLVLIAPAIGIRDLWISRLPAGDPIVVFNYARNGDAPVHRAFFERMATVTADDAPPETPVSVIMGRLDESVPFDRVAAVWDRWTRSGGLAAASRFIEIENGDHGLTGFVPEIVREIVARLAALVL